MSSSLRRKKQTAKLSGYALFAKEYSGRRTNPGNNFYVTLSEIENAKEPWERLSKSEKERFKRKAKELNIKFSTNSQHHSSQSAIVQEDKRVNHYETNNSREEIRNVINNSIELGELDTTVFYIVSASHFYEDSNSIFPAEIAFAKYSMMEGIIDSMSIRINPGKLPLGTVYAAQTHSKETHRYPLPDDKNCEGESDYIEILIQILNFIEPLKKIPILYTEGHGHSNTPHKSKTLESTRKVFKQIFEGAGEYITCSQLKIYSIYELLFELKKKIVEMKQGIDVNNDDYAFRSIRDVYQSYCASNNDFDRIVQGCEFHNENDVNNHCCLSSVLRQCYIISNWCCQTGKYELKPGHHFP